MNSFINISAILILCCTTLGAQSNRPNKTVNVAAKTEVVAASSIEGPEIQFESLVHDYGTIARGANGQCEFKFKNIGNEPLIINDVKTSCGCAVPSFTREPVMPGSVGVIKVEYNTNSSGPISKSVQVVSNAKSYRVSLQLSGSVQ